jgi:hypothetical protein
MKSFAIFLVIFFGLFCAPPGWAQNTGRIECARNDGYVYLYSSVTTLDVRATLQCAEIVQILGRDDAYFSVRNAKGDTGFVPMSSIVVLKDQPGTGLPTTGMATPARERMHYDNGPRETSPPPTANDAVFMLANNTPIRVKLTKTISSLTAHPGDSLEFEILEDLMVDGLLVLTKGTKANGVVAEAETKKRFGKSGKLTFNITSVRLANGIQAPLRCYQQATGSSNTSSDAVLPLASGKDVSVPQDTEFTALVDGDVHLKRESFANAKDASPISPAASQSTTKPKP